MLGIDVTARWTVVILEVLEPLSPGQADASPQEMRNALFLKHIRPYLSSYPNSLCAVINQRILLLFPDRNRYEVLACVNQIRGELEGAYQAAVCGGMSAEGRRGLEIRRCYQEARTASQTARTDGGRRILRYDEVSLEFLADSIAPDIRRDLVSLVFSGCTPEERESIRSTVLLYFQYHGDVKQMADALYVHKNTVHYHLQRIQALTGYSVRDPRGSVLLYLACLSSPQRRAADPRKRIVKEEPLCPFTPTPRRFIHSALEACLPDQAVRRALEGKELGSRARLFSRPGQGRLADGPLCRGAAGSQAGTGRGGHQAWTQPG